MAEFNIHVDDLKHGNDHPVAQSILILKTLINDNEIIFDLDLALTEAIANVARHAYPDETTGPLSIRIRTSPDRHVELTISDRGQGMKGVDPVRILPEPEAEHGRGIPLMTSLCDRVDFKCNDGTNIVKMTKKIPSEAWRR